MRLELVLVAIEGGDLNGETLPLADSGNNLIPELALSERVTLNKLPMVEHALGEGLSCSLRTEIRIEAEGLSHGQVCLDVVQGGTRALVLLEHVATAPVQARVDSTHGLLRALDLNKEHRLHELGAGDHLGGVHDTAGRGDDLAATTVDGIRVHGYVEDREADTTHVLLADHALLCHPVEPSNNGILHLIQVLHSLGAVDHQVGPHDVRTEGPDLASNVHIPAVLVGQQTSTDLDIVTGSDLSAIDLVGEVLAKGTGLEVKTVMLVRGLRHALLVGLRLHSLTVGHDGVRDLERRTVHVIILKILQADLHVKLTGTGNDMLARLLDRDDNHRIGLRKALETLDKLGQILGVLGLHSATHDRGHGELHVLHRVGVLVGGDGSGLDQELIDTDHTAGVSDGHVLNGVLAPAHEEHNTLDGLDVQVILLPLLVVGTHDAHLDASLHGARENTTERDETTLVGSGNHLGHVEHEGRLRVAVAHTHAACVIHGTSVKQLGTVLLGHVRGRKVEDHHLKERLVGRQPVLHGALEEGLALELEILLLHLDVQRGKHLLELVHLLVHASSHDLADRVQHEHVEGTEVSVASLGPLLLSRVEVVLTPKPLAHLVLRNTELLGVHAGELRQGEGPAVKTRRETDSSLLRVNLEISHGLVTVGGDDNVHVLHVLHEVGVERLPVELELKEATVKLVDRHDRLDTLSKSLAKHSLGLDGHTLDTVDNHQGSVGDTKSSSHLGGEVNVARGIDEVDDELTALRVLGHPLITDLLRVDLVVKRDASGLDGDATLGLVGTGIGKTLISRGSHRNNTSSRHKGIREGGLSVVNVSNHGHVADLLRFVHDSTELRNCEIHHGSKFVM
mmetsp:Transcript_18805/g.38200  ORF Transcript_18805/g.38200 Transcript_18805/m.38200 type:complete len:850 (-) Transcript_18805:55-2604(-)